MRKSRWLRDSISRSGNHSENTRLRNGSAMPNSASGLIGDRSAWKVRATGWHAICIKKAHTLTIIIKNIMAIHQRWDSRIFFHSSKQKNGILTNSWKDTNASERNISLSSVTTTTTSTFGIRNISHGIL